MISNLCYAQPSPKFQVTGSHMLEHQLPGWAPANAAAETSRSICSFRCNMKHQPEKWHIWKNQTNWSYPSSGSILSKNLLVSNLSENTILSSSTQMHVPQHENAVESMTSKELLPAQHSPAGISSMSFNRIKAGSHCLPEWRGPCEALGFSPFDLLVWKQPDVLVAPSTGCDWFS